MRSNKEMLFHLVQWNLANYEDQNALLCSFKMVRNSAAYVKLNLLDNFRSIGNHIFNCNFHIKF